MKLGFLNRYRRWRRERTSERMAAQQAAEADRRKREEKERLLMSVRADRANGHKKLKKMIERKMQEASDRDDEGWN